MVKKEKKVSSKTIYEGKIVDLYVDEVICQNNNKAIREVIRHCKASCILALNDKNEIIIEKQYRYPYDDFLYELPAGKCDKDEDPQTTALRELEEETGYKANNIKYLGKLYPSCAYTDEVIYMYLATDLIKTQKHLDENEFIDISFMKLDDVYDLIKQDKINDAKTIATLMQYKLLTNKN